MTGRLTNFRNALRHPSDPRVMRTRSEKVFLQASVLPDFGAAIFIRGEEKKTPLRAAFNRMAASVPALAALNMTLKGEADPGGEIRFRKSYEGLAEIKPELRKMVRAFHRITSLRRLRIDIFADLAAAQPHPHPFPVLNCTWLEAGTQWTSPSGEILQVDEGDWLFIRPDFIHFSPPKKEDLRLTVIVRPDSPG